MIFISQLQTFPATVNKQLSIRIITKILSKLSSININKNFLNLKAHNIWPVWDREFLYTANPISANLLNTVVWCLLSVLVTPSKLQLERGHRPPPLLRLITHCETEGWQSWGHRSSKHTHTHECKPELPLHLSTVSLSYADRLLTNTTPTTLCP